MSARVRVQGLDLFRHLVQILAWVRENRVRAHGYQVSTVLGRRACHKVLTYSVLPFALMVWNGIVFPPGPSCSNAG